VATGSGRRESAAANRKESHQQQGQSSNGHNSSGGGQAKNGIGIIGTDAIATQQVRTRREEGRIPPIPTESFASSGFGGTPNPVEAIGLLFEPFGGCPARRQVGIRFPCLRQ
jgi:hypothetical protein